MFIATPVFLLDYYFVCLRAFSINFFVYITHIFLTFCSLSSSFSYSGFCHALLFYTVAEFKDKKNGHLKMEHSLWV